MKTGFEHFDTDALAWWVWHMDNGGCESCPSTAKPETEAMVRAEWAKRPQVPPRHLRHGRKGR
jgi:hypothetical protein